MCRINNAHVCLKKHNNTSHYIYIILHIIMILHIFTDPIGSMYAIYGNIYHSYTPSGSYGYYILAGGFKWILFSISGCHPSRRSPSFFESSNEFEPLVIFTVCYWKRPIYISFMDIYGWFCLNKCNCPCFLRVYLRVSMFSCPAFPKKNKSLRHSSDAMQRNVWEAAAVT
jgi:hypothetical protein